MTRDPPPIGELMAHPAVRGAAAEPMTAGQRRRGLIAVLASMLAVGLTFGTAIPMIALLLEQRGVSSAVIGLNSSMSLLATVLLSPVVPRLVKRTGTMPALLGGIAVIITGYMLMPVFSSLASWFALRFIIGIGMAIHWVVSETWLNAAAPPARRGLYAGIYATLMGMGFAIGPTLLTVIEISGWMPFLVVSAFIFAAGIPLAFAAGAVPVLEISVESGRWSALRTAPTIYAAIFVSGLVDTSILSLLPIYGLRSGITQNEAVILLSVAIAGTVAFQLPIGWLTDRAGTRWLLFASGLIGMAGALTIPAALEIPALLWPILFVWGGVIAGLYTIGLTELGHRFTGGALASANALFVMVYCIGSLVGPTISGSMMDIAGPRGFPWTIASVFAAFLVVALVRTRRRQAA